MSDKGTVPFLPVLLLFLLVPLLIPAGRQSPDLENQDPKQGKEATASGSVDKDNKQFDKSTDEEKKGSQKTLEGLPSNPDRKARV